MVIFKGKKKPITDSEEILFLFSYNAICFDLLRLHAKQTM